MTPILDKVIDNAPFKTVAVTTFKIINLQISHRQGTAVGIVLLVTYKHREKEIE